MPFRLLPQSWQPVLPTFLWLQGGVRQGRLVPAPPHLHGAAGPQGQHSQGYSSQEFGSVSPASGGVSIGFLANVCTARDVKSGAFIEQLGVSEEFVCIFWGFEVLQPVYDSSLTALFIEGRLPLT